MMQEYLVPEEAAGTRIDKFLADACPDLSRSFLQKLLKESSVTADGKAVKSSFKVNGGETIAFEVPKPQEAAIEAENIPLDILYEDSDIILVNKPKLNIQPMVATLIMFTAGRGIAQLITDGQITYVRVDSYRTLGASLPGFPVPTPFIVAVVVVALTSLLLKKTALGMYIQSVGINKRASQLVGIKSVMIIFLTYAYCGLCSGLSGLIASSRIYSADANNIGLNMELDAILAVAIGGNSLGGGKFSLAGSVIGAYTIQALTTTLYAMHVSSDQVPVYKAIVVVIIVALQSPGFARWRKSLAQKKELSAAGKEAA